MDWPTTGEAVIAALVLAIRVGDHLLDRRSAATKSITDQQRDAEHQARLNSIESKVDLRFNELKGYVIGQDGKNGLRGDVSEIKIQAEKLDQKVTGIGERVIRLEERQPPRRSRAVARVR